MSHSILVEAPIGTFMVDIPAPTVVNVVLELAFIEEIVDLTSKSLHPSCLIHLSERLFIWVLSNPHVIVYLRIGIPNDVPSIQDSIFPPSLQHRLKLISVAKRRDCVVIFRFCLEFICQNLWELWLWLLHITSQCLSVVWCTIVNLWFIESWWDVFLPSHHFLVCDHRTDFEILGGWALSWAVFHWRLLTTDRFLSFWRWVLFSLRDVMFRCFLLGSFLNSWRYGHRWSFIRKFSFSSVIVLLLTMQRRLWLSFLWRCLHRYNSWVNNWGNIFLRHKVFWLALLHLGLLTCFKVIISSFFLLAPVYWWRLWDLRLLCIHSCSSVIWPLLRVPRCNPRWTLFEYWSRFFKFGLLLAHFIKLLCFKMELLPFPN